MVMTPAPASALIIYFLVFDEDAAAVVAPSTKALRAGREDLATAIVIACVVIGVDANKRRAPPRNMLSRVDITKQQQHHQEEEEERK
eukprot:m.135457 g.135457  ORF g.135457 m.135457 type:complete len:87 (-) comp10021_c0_seq1:82-342(-)